MSNATPSAQFQKVFGRAPEIVTRAPGRIEFIGNHTDYNGGTVLGASIDRGVTVALAKRTDGKRNFYSTYNGKTVTLEAGAPVKQSGEASWTNYPLGVLAALPHFGQSVIEGFDYYADSDLPAGAGLSSSAAIELASALAFLGATGQHPDRETVVKIGKHAENHFVGVPCGILDQGVSGFGKAGHLVFIDCAGPRFDTVPMPAGASFWIFNTHTKHALVDGLYSARHRECMAAAQALGVKWLVDVSVDQLRAAEAKIEPTAFKRARHVVEEIARVDATVKALGAGKIAEVGALLTASHRSSQHLFENSTEELDFLVDALVASTGVYGARLTGGGFGGAVMALAGPSFGAAQAEAVAAAYAAKFGARPDILPMGTGDGAKVL
ncbi:MAG: galactokinase [Opitutaceae bacterium]|jgi:galactokinase|nr:galactokinase [Opitutaceae bacterium]